MIDEDGVTGCWLFQTLHNISAGAANVTTCARMSETVWASVHHYFICTVKWPVEILFAFAL